MLPAHLHAVDGQIRVKIPGLKGSPQRALEIKGHLRKYAGIDHVLANRTTGNLLVFYNPQRIEQRQVLRALRRFGWLRQVRNGDSPTASVPESLGRSSRRYGSERAAPSWDRSSTAEVFRGDTDEAC